jgi:hypothetical protein
MPASASAAPRPLWLPKPATSAAPTEATRATDRTTWRRRHEYGLVCLMVQNHLEIDKLHGASRSINHIQVVQDAFAIAFLLLLPLWVFHRIERRNFYDTWRWRFLRSGVWLNRLT